MRVEAFEFDTGGFGCEVPVDGFSRGISLVLPGGGFLGEGRDIWDASVQALFGQDAQFNLGHVEPAAVFGGEVDVEAFDQTAGFGRGKGFIQ